MVSKSSLIFFIIINLLIIGCNDSKKQVQKPASKPIVSNKEVPTGDPDKNIDTLIHKAEPIQVKPVEEIIPLITDKENEIFLKFYDVDKVFSKVIKTQWQRVSATSEYVLQKTFIGETDNLSIFGIGSDDLDWDINADQIILNVDTNLVYANSGSVKYKNFVSKVIGHIELSIGEVEVHLDIEHFIVKDSHVIKINSEKFAQLGAEPPVISRDCPRVVSLMKFCNPYGYTIDVLGAIDFNAIGEAGPAVANNVVSVKNIVSILKSFITFSPDINSIRDNFLVPLLVSIKQLKSLNQLDTSNHFIYIDETTAVYSNLINTSLSSVLKAQKMMPEVITSLAPHGLGILLAYVGAEEAGDELIARKQPKWFKEIVSPIIREFGVLTIDIIMNTSGSSMEDRIARYMGMEQQLRDSLVRLCENPSSSKNDCKRALTY